MSSITALANFNEAESVSLAFVNCSRYRIDMKGVTESTIGNRKIMKPFIDRRGYIKVQLINDTGKQKSMYLHRLLAEAFLPNRNNKEEVDHIDRNTGNYDLSNLRWVTRAQQMMNREKNNNSITGMKGVTLKQGKFLARIAVNGTRIYLGIFASATDAAKAYDDAARLHFGEFACVNTI
jgi:hypothetical protein